MAATPGRSVFREVLIGARRFGTGLRHVRRERTDWLEHNGKGKGRRQVHEVAAEKGDCDMGTIGVCTSDAATDELYDLCKSYLRFEAPARQQNDNFGGCVCRWRSSRRLTALQKAETRCASRTSSRSATHGRAQGVSSGENWRGETDARRALRGGSASHREGRAAGSEAGSPPLRCAAGAGSLWSNSWRR